MGDRKRTLALTPRTGRCRAAQRGSALVLRRGNTTLRYCTLRFAIRAGRFRAESTPHRRRNNGFDRAVGHHGVAYNTPGVADAIPYAAMVAQTALGKLWSGWDTRLSPNLSARTEGQCRRARVAPRGDPSACSTASPARSTGSPATASPECGCVSCRRTGRTSPWCRPRHPRRSRP